MAPIFVIRDIDTYLGRAGPVFLNIWIFFNLVANTIFLPLLVATFLFSKRAKRHPTLVNLCLTWIFSGEFSLLLFYANEHVGPEPTKGLCIAQTSLLYGITPMWSVSVFMLFWYMTIAICGDRKKSVIKTPKLIFMLASPYIVQCSFSLAALFVSLNKPERVTRELRHFYCALAYHPLAVAMTLFTLAMCIGIIILEVHLAVTAYRNWCCLRNANKHNGVDYQFYLRVLSFGAFVAFGMIVNLIFILCPKSIIPDMYAATAGTIVFLVFGTQTDVLHVWCFWLPEPKPLPEPEPICELTRNSFWRRSEATFEQDMAELFANLPPPPPPKSKEYLMSIGAKLPEKVNTGTPPGYC